MATPNIVNIASMYGKTAALAVTTTPTAIVTNPASSGKVLKVNLLMVGNTDPAVSYKITADLWDGTTAIRFVPSMSIPANSGSDILAKFVYVNEGYSLRLTADANTKLEAVTSYEEVA